MLVIGASGPARCDASQRKSYALETSYILPAHAGFQAAQHGPRGRGLEADRLGCSDADRPAPQHQVCRFSRDVCALAFTVLPLLILRRLYTNVVSLAMA